MYKRQLLNKAAQDLCANTGYEELSLSSLSTSDHSQLEELLDDLNGWAPKEHVSLSLPSLRMDNFSQSLIEKTTKVRKSGLTFAAEAGTCLLYTSRCAASRAVRNPSSKSCPQLWASASRCRWPTALPVCCG